MASNFNPYKKGFAFNIAIIRKLHQRKTNRCPGTKAVCPVRENDGHLMKIRPSKGEARKLLLFMGALRPLLFPRTVMACCVNAT